MSDAHNRMRRDFLLRVMREICGARKREESCIQITVRRDRSMLTCSPAFALWETCFFSPEAPVFPPEDFPFPPDDLPPAIMYSGKIRDR